MCAHFIGCATHCSGFPPSQAPDSRPCIVSHPHSWANNAFGLRFIFRFNYKLLVTRCPLIFELTFNQITMHIYNYTLLWICHFDGVCFFFFAFFCLFVAHQFYRFARVLKWSINCGSEGISETNWVHCNNERWAAATAAAATATVLFYAARF